VRTLNLSLERDADEYAVRTTGDRPALASAICKAAVGSSFTAPIGLGTSDSTTARLDHLVAEVRAEDALRQSAAARFSPSS
jgi:hypothetical protein